MADKVWGQPDIPPAEKNVGSVVTRFKGYIDSDQTTAKGQYKIIVMVPHSEKYKAALAVDMQHVMLHFEVYGPGEDETDHVIMELLELEGDEE